MTPSFPSPLLVVEASSRAGSVALFVDGALVAERDIAMGPSREDAILPTIANMLSAAGIAPKHVRAIACGSGPGSFTSLRIAASLAKGLAVANNANLFAVPSMLLAAAALRDKPGEYVLHSDALRGERYVARVYVSASGNIEMSNE
ncbi:MAG: tRNA (adenosine(37)-N6)-threonylcarbamoyltransferase complex dimerization subunit type 1 TsaB, partial [Gemmatimonadaceae bacterium]